MATINHINYDWCKVNVFLNVTGQSVRLETVQNIEYKYDVESEPLYGLGSSDPVAMAFGKRTYSGKITVGFHDILRLQEASNEGGEIVGLEGIASFDIIVKYTERDTKKIITDRVNGVRLLSNRRMVGNDKLNITMEIPLFISSIDYNVDGITIKDITGK